MTFTYSGDPGDSALDEVRFLIQDTDENDPLLTDEEINYLIGVYSDPYLSAIASVNVLIAQASRAVEESKKVADLSLTVKYGARVAQWETLLKYLKQEQFRRNPAAPIVNANVLLPTDKRDIEDEGSDFVVGQMDNKT